MFSRKDASNEIAIAMEKYLFANARSESDRAFEKIASAVEHLNAAAEIFDEAGLTKEAEIATRLLEVFAAKKGKKKKPTKSKPKSKSPSKSKKPVAKTKKSDPATKGLDSEKMVENLRSKGWVFNADAHDEDCMCSMCCDKSMAADDDKKLKNHGEDCQCMYCMDAPDKMQMADDTNYAHNDRDAALNEIMEDLREDDFEDDPEAVLPGDDYSQAMHMMEQRHGDVPADLEADEMADRREELWGPFPYRKPRQQ